jgi:Rad3-related DNA helicase
MFRSPEQEAVAAAIRSAIEDGATVLIHASTGIGKTRAMLVETIRAAAGGKRILLATQNTQLVQQMLDGPDMRAARALHPSIEVRARVSMAQFLSPARAATAGAQILPGDTLEEVSARTGIPPTRLCLTPSCPRLERVEYEHQAKAARLAPIVVTTHAALAMDARVQFQMLGANAFDAILVDEADTLPSSARSVMTRLVTVEELRGLHAALRAAGIDRSGLTGAANRLEAGHIEDAMQAVLHATSNARQVTDIDLRDALALVRIAAQDVLDGDYQGRKVVASENGVRVIYRRPARVLRSLFEKVQSAALLSGTLAVNGDFRSIRAATGLYGAREVMIEPRRFGYMRIMLAARDVPTPNERTGRSAWLDYVAAGVKAAAADGGRILILTASYADTSDLCARLTDLPLIEHRRGERLQDVLKPIGSGSIFVTPAAWTGIDLPGAWTHVVIPKIPFEIPDEQLDEVFEIDDGAAWLDAQSRAIRRLRQGIGRGIRNEADSCVLWILDPRFPIPAQMVNAGHATQGNAAHLLPLANAIPKRFRSGLWDAWSSAKIF